MIFKMFRTMWNYLFGYKQLIVPPSHKRAPFLQSIGHERAFLCAGDKGCHKEIPYSVADGQERDDAFTKAVYEHLDQFHPGWEFPHASERN